MAEIPNAFVKRLLRNAGAERVSKDACHALAKLLEEEAVRVAGLAVNNAKQHGRKTTKGEDITSANEALIFAKTIGISPEEALKIGAARAERVKIWNTFFKLAWQMAKDLYESDSGEKCSFSFEPLGGTLPDKEFHTLATLLLTYIAIEARTNHLIEELKEKQIIDEETANAAKYIPTHKKWFLLPLFAGKATKFDSSRGIHQGVNEICKFRNDIVHVNFTKISEKLPTPGKMLKLFKDFVEAMENMNVVLERGVEKERDEVLKYGDFKKLCGKS
ncbi:MAG TPA: histone [Desulfobacteria bacterium]|nr:histone [Desulfobacteria bacterium]